MVKTPRLAVFGGSGKTGRELIAVALKKGVLVRALYRPGSEPRPLPGLEIITGQSRDEPSARHSLVACIHGRVRRKRIPRQSLPSFASRMRTAEPGAPAAAPAAVVAGIAALTLAVRPDLSAAALKKILMDNATRLPALAGKIACGGMVNAYSNLRAASR